MRTPDDHSTGPPRPPVTKGGSTREQKVMPGRREFLWQYGGGLGGIALAELLGRGGLLADETPAAARAGLNGGLHHRARAKRVVQLFMSGAASQCDMFDYKPALIERNGMPFDPGEKVELF